MVSGLGSSAWSAYYSKGGSDGEGSFVSVVKDDSVKDTVSEKLKGLLEKVSKSSRMICVVALGILAALGIVICGLILAGVAACTPLLTAGLVMQSVLNAIIFSSGLIYLLSPSNPASSCNKVAKECTG